MPTNTPEQSYIRDQFVNDKLTYAHLEALVRFFQSYQNQHTTLQTVALKVDGRPGQRTLAAIEKIYQGLFIKDVLDTPAFLSCPLRNLGYSTSFRKPVITSGYRTKDRPDHDGVDMFYPYKDGDQPNWVGDGGCEGKTADGKPKWVVPYQTEALAAADGVVMMSGPSPTGFRVWINHHNGLRSGYFHLEKIFFETGVSVKKGTAIGFVGHNPAVGKDGKPVADGRHLHFEVSPVEKYAPVDPQKYLLAW